MRSILITVFVCNACTLCSALPKQHNDGSKREWLDDWRRLHVNNEYSLSLCESHTRQCVLPRYVAPRTSVHQLQNIPKVIWQTWKSSTVGPFQYAAMTSFIRDNPDYEYVMLDDAAALDFICWHTDAKTALAYETLAVGAAKADLLRIVVLLEYGGVYVDSDCASLTPFDSFVWPNASMVSGIGLQGDFHQWVLLYVAGHPFLRSALHAIVRNIFDANTQGRVMPVVDMTGPTAYHDGGVLTVLQDHNCTLSPAEAASKKLELLSSTTSCSSLSAVAGVIQLMTGDFLGNNIVFKDNNVIEERAHRGYVGYMSLERQTTTLFNDVQLLCHKHARSD